MLPVKFRLFDSPFVDRDEFLTPFSSMFDTLYNDMFKDFNKDFFEKGTYPKIDVRDESDCIIIDAEVPGLTKDQIKVEIDGASLRIKGEKKKIDETKSKTYIHKELKHSAFCRSFTIGKNIKMENISSKFENGVLEIVLPKIKPEEKPKTIRQIEIK